jgi:hypothetical protein
LGSFRVSNTDRRPAPHPPLVREIVTAYLGEAKSRNRLRLMEGVAKGPADLGRSHDDALYGDE